VYKNRVLAAEFLAHLADGLKERQRLNIANRPPISTIVTSAPFAETLRMAFLISLVTCGITWTSCPGSRRGAPSK